MKVIKQSARGTVPILLAPFVCGRLVIDDVAIVVAHPSLSLLVRYLSEEVSGQEERAID